MRSLASDPRPPTERLRIRLAGALRVLAAELRACTGGGVAAPAVRSVVREVLDRESLEILRASLVDDDDDAPPAPLPPVTHCPPAPPPEDGAGADR